MQPQKLPQKALQTYAMHLTLHVSYNKFNIEKLFVEVL